MITCPLVPCKYRSNHIEPLTDKEYFVRGCTALLDAIGQAINKMDNVQKHLPEDYKAGKVLFVITLVFIKDFYR